MSPTITSVESPTAELALTMPELVNYLVENVKGNMACTFTAETTPAMNKTGNPYFGKIRKQSRVNAMIGFDYEKAVNRLAAKEGQESRQAKPRQWGRLILNRLFVEHKGQLYLRARVLSTATPTYLLEGKAIPSDQIKPFLSKPSKSSTQADLQGEVIERDYKIHEITSFTFAGTTYAVTHAYELATQAYEQALEMEKELA